MNSEQLEELEALGYIFNESEMQIDENRFEFLVNPEQSLFVQIVWPESYPTCALLFAISDNRLARTFAKEIEQEVNQFAETLAGSAATFAVVDFVKENLERWNVVQRFGEVEDEERERDEEGKDVERKVVLNKAQKRKMYKYVGANGERPRGWNWVDIISHVFCM